VSAYCFLSNQNGFSTTRLGASAGDLSDTVSPVWGTLYLNRSISQSANSTMAAVVHSATRSFGQSDWFAVVGYSLTYELASYAHFAFEPGPWHLPLQHSSSPTQLASNSLQLIDGDAVGQKLGYEEGTRLGRLLGAALGSGLLGERLGCSEGVGVGAVGP